LHVASALAEFIALHPELSVDLTISDRIVDLVATMRITDEVGQNLVARRLAPIRRRICASPAYLQRYGTPHTAAVSTTASITPISISRACGGCRMAKPAWWCIRQFHQRRRGIVAGGAGWAGVGAVAYILWQELQAGRLIEVLPGTVPLARSLYAVYLPSAFTAESACVRSFLPSGLAVTYWIGCLERPRVRGY
jgi:DNA-binding transcriptional LysR family regulator